jgi:signal transduction histidine kinase
VKKKSSRRSQTTYLKYPRNSIFYKIYLWISGRHWWFIGLAGIALFFVEAYDFIHNDRDYIHVAEFVIYTALLLVVGILIDLLITEIRIQTQTKEILAFKHKLSLEFSGYHDWDGLVDHIVRFPGRIGPVTQACLLVSDPISGEFVPTAQWNCTGETAYALCTTEICESCRIYDPTVETTFCSCESDSSSNNTGPQSQKYCFSFRYGGRVLGILPFMLEAGEALSDEQMELFENIGDEIAIALQGGQDRRAFYDMRKSETALEERRDLSHYLHDHLGQSLGFLHIKIDQLIIDRNKLTLDQVYVDILKMREAVNDSYEIVRGILETIHAETAPSLNNLLMEHARKISQRANLEIDFKTKGQPAALPVETQRAVFYAFEESLSNAEKHAQATKIDIVAEWGMDNLTLSISDDGVGFNPQAIDTDQHFGMEILNERMAKVNGRVTLTSSENSGTVVNIHIPRISQGP